MRREDGKLFESIRRWLGAIPASTGMTPPGRRRAAGGKMCPIKPPLFELLECRLLPDAELTGMQFIPSQETTAPEQVIQVPQSPTGIQARNGTELFDISPALFVENQGQWSDPSIRYVHDGNRVDVAVTGSGMVFQVAPTQPAPEDGGQRAEDRGQNAVPSSTLRPAGTDVLRFGASFVGARQALPVGLERSSSEFNYFVGDQSLWRRDVPAYERVVYEGLYDGVDLHVHGLGSHLKYEFQVAPGADWSQISIRYDGIGGLSLAGDGTLVLDLGGDWGTLVDDRPYIYQVIDGQCVSIAGGFRLLDNRTCAFDLPGWYDPTRELVIDPNLVWSSYLGGSGGDWGYDIALDSGGNVYITGQTQSSDLSIGDSGTTYQGVSDAFVAKFSPAGACLWSTYLGGSGDDRANGIALDSGGNVCVVGQTESAYWTSNGFDTTHNGAADAFAAKLSPAGNVLWSTYVGGSDGDWGYGLAVDSSDNIYVTGQTWSSDWVIGGSDMEYNGPSDGFVAKLSAAGACLWSTYVGGGDRDWGYGVAADSSDNVYVTGVTLSPGWTNGGFDTDPDGGLDAFVAKLSVAGGSLWSTYLGGSSDDYGRDIAIDSSDNVYVTGTTESSGWPNEVLGATYHGDSDAFVAKLSSAGASLWSTYVGAAAGEWGYGITADSSGNVYVTGTTESPGWTTGGFDTTYHGGDSDAFVAKLGPGGGSLWSSYLGGSNGDSGYGIAVDSWGCVYATGQTQSFDGTKGGFDTVYGGSGDAFLVKIMPGTLAPVYRFWKASDNTHFFTIKESEKQKLIDNYSDVYTYERVAYYAYVKDQPPEGTLPVYRFWKAADNTHFYTIKESEKQKLIDSYSDIYTYEGPAFYAYATDQHPIDTLPVYRFWKAADNTHFFTMKESEKQKLIDQYFLVYTYERAVWYAYAV